MKTITLIKDFLELLKSNNSKIINTKIDLCSESFSDPLNLTGYTFSEYVSFKEITFKDEVKFDDCVFKKDVDFSESIFEADTYFRNVVFAKNVSFENTEAKEGTIDFNGVSFQKVNFEKIVFKHPNFINMYPQKPNREFTKENFSSQESVRAVKAFLEEQRNNTEATRYFVVEREFLLHKLKNNKNYIRLVPLLFDKYISDYGTNYFRVFISILVIYTMLYFFLNYIFCFWIGKHVSFNEFLGVVIPLKSLGIQQTSEILSIIPIWVTVLMRIITIYFVYQFIRSFRTDTKRV